MYVYMYVPLIIPLIMNVYSICVHICIYVAVCLVIDHPKISFMRAGIFMCSIFLLTLLPSKIVPGTDQAFGVNIHVLKERH